eukprot:158822_1
MALEAKQPANDNDADETKGDDDDCTVLRECTCVKAIENSVPLTKLSSGLFCMNDNSNLIHIVHFVGNTSWIGIGHTVHDDDKKDIQYFVSKEEMLYLMECGCCELLIEYKMEQNNESQQTCIGLNNTFTLFFSLQNDSSFNFTVYSVFKKLKLMNYLVQRTNTVDNKGCFESTSYWIWKRGSNQWWKALCQGFKSDSVQSVASSLNKLSQKKPDALVLIQRNNQTKKDNMNVSVLHSIIQNIGNIPIIIANASQNDVMLFQFEINDLSYSEV